jgi:hypothetical protein
MRAVPCPVRLTIESEIHILLFEHNTVGEDAHAAYHQVCEASPALKLTCVLKLTS